MRALPFRHSPNLASRSDKTLLLWGQLGLSGKFLKILLIDHLSLPAAYSFKNGGFHAACAHGVAEKSGSSAVKMGRHNESH
jgi:hypothetical protein